MKAVAVFLLILIPGVSFAAQDPVGTLKATPYLSVQKALMASNPSAVKELQPSFNALSVNADRSEITFEQVLRQRYQSASLITLCMTVADKIGGPIDHLTKPLNDKLRKESDKLLGPIANKCAKLLFKEKVGSSSSATPAQEGSDTAS